MLTLDRSARWTCWFNAWLAGDTSLDDARDGVVADDAAHDVVGLDPAEPLPLVLAWGRIRARGAQAARLVLPQPGDPSGLAGPPDFNEAALEAGEAVLIEGAGLGLVPTAVGQGVFWQASPAQAPAFVPQVADAEQALRHELIRAARALSDLDVARWQPEVAEALSELREETAPALAPGYPARAEQLAALAHRCLTIAELASNVPSGAISAYEDRARDRSLEALARQARHGLVAACSDRSHR